MVNVEVEVEVDGGLVLSDERGTISPMLALTVDGEDILPVCF